MNIPRSEHPNPQWERETWKNLNGTWEFEFDFGTSALGRKLWEKEKFDKEIIVPFCPESKLSGIAYTDFIDGVAYRRHFELTEEETESESEADTKETVNESKAETVAETLPAQTEPVTEAIIQTEAVTEPVTEPVKTVIENISVDVISGMDSGSVSKLLYAAGVVNDAAEFDRYLVNNNYANNIRTENYIIPKGSSYDEIAKILTGR